MMAGCRRPPLVPLASLVSVVNDLQGQRLQGTSGCRAHGRGRERGQLAHSLVSLSLSFSISLLQICMHSLVPQAWSFAVPAAATSSNLSLRSHERARFVGAGERAGAQCSQATGLQGLGARLASSLRKGFSSLRMSGKQPAAPVAKIETKETTLHGKTRSDPYHWMKDENWQQVCGASFQLSARALQCA